MRIEEATQQVGRMRALLMGCLLNRDAALQHPRGGVPLEPHASGARAAGRASWRATQGA